MRKFKDYIGAVTLVVVCWITFIKIIDATIEGGVYRYIVIGAIFEMTWLFSLLCLAVLPILWLVYILRKEIAFKKGGVYIGICVLTILGVLFL